MACVDTSTVIDLLRGPRHPRYKAADQFVGEFVLNGEVLRFSRITHAELLAGAYHSRASERELTRIRDTLEPMVVLELDAESADVFGRIQGSLRNAGHAIGDMDAFIAATWIAHHQPLITANPKHFRKVEGLKVLTYL